MMLDIKHLSLKRPSYETDKYSQYCHIDRVYNITARKSIKVNLKQKKLSTNCTAMGSDGLYRNETH